jgi:hypothetical protein
VSETRVTLHFDGDFDLPIGDVFPDGVPDPLTVEHVVEAIQSAGDVGGLISAWGVAPTVAVTLNQPVANGRRSDYRQVKL